MKAVETINLYYWDVEIGDLAELLVRLRKDKFSIQTLEAYEPEGQPDKDLFRVEAVKRKEIL